MPIHLTIKIRFVVGNKGSAGVKNLVKKGSVKQTSPFKEYSGTISPYRDSCQIYKNLSLCI